MTKKTTTFQIPVKTVSEANSSEHWIKKANRHKIQKWMIRKSFRDHDVNVTLPIEITLTRIAPRMLDAHDNLPCCFKYFVDAIAAELTGIKQAGRADDCKEITWKYDQKKGRVREYSVEIKIEEK
jgi:hypothetical protein